MTNQAKIDATLALAEARGFSMQQWSGCWTLTSGPVDQRLCTDCGRWRKLNQFRQLQSVCEGCVRLRGRLRYEAVKAKKRRENG